jgi:hypothetical protein
LDVGADAAEVDAADLRLARIAGTEAVSLSSSWASVSAVTTDLKSGVG